jgi:hypothetical protein
MTLDSQTIIKLLKSETFAWFVGAIIVLMFAVFAFIYVGWLGIGGLGICGLYLTQRMEMHGDNADASFDHHIVSSEILAQQQKARNTMRPEEKEALKAKEESRKRTRYLMNTLWLAIAALGFWMFANTV